MLILRTNPILAKASFAAFTRNVTAAIGVESAVTRRKAAKREYQDRRWFEKAKAHVERLPEPGETIHLLVAGDYRSWDLVPALIDLARQPARELWIATLSYNRDILDSLAALLDSGRVARCHFVTSVFDKDHDPARFAAAKEILAARPGCRLLAMRNHCKILALRFDGCCLTAESSANLRSHSTTEQIALTNDPGLYAFHTGWLDQALSQGGDADYRTARQLRLTV